MVVSGGLLRLKVEGEPTAFYDLDHVPALTSTVWKTVLTNMPGSSTWWMVSLSSLARTQDYFRARLNPPPDTALTLTPPNPSPAAVSFSFSASEGGCSFQCQLDSGGWSPCSSPVSYPALASGLHTFRVRAVDSVGNTDASPAQYTWTVDADPPDTLLTSTPPNPSPAAVSFSFSASEGGCSFQCQLDSGGWSSCASPVAYPALATGSHTFQVRAIDAVGNMDTSPAQYTWTVDADPPDTLLTSTPPNPSPAAVSFSFSASEGGCSFQCQLDSGGWSSCASPVAYPALATGSHTFQVRAIDAVGNMDASPAQYTWTVDANPPDTLLTSTPPNPSPAAVSFSFNASEGGCSFQCQLDSGGWSSCSSPVNYPALATGSYLFQVRAIDAVGNTDASPAQYTWTVDATPPDITIHIPTWIAALPGAVQLSFTAIGAGTTSCRLDGAAWRAWPSDTPCRFDSHNGSHSFEVLAVDPIGNWRVAAFNWENYGIPERVRVQPVLFVPVGQPQPTDETWRKTKRYLALAQERYGVLLGGLAILSGYWNPSSCRAHSPSTTTSTRPREARRRLPATFFLLKDGTDPPVPIFW